MSSIAHLVLLACNLMFMCFMFYLINNTDTLISNMLSTFLSAIYKQQPPFGMKIYICYLPAGRSVLYWEKLCPRSWAVLKNEGTVFPNTDRPRLANNVFIFFCGKLLYKKYLCWFFTEAVSHHELAFDVSWSMFSLSG